MDPSKPQISKYLSPLSIADFYMDFANDGFETPFLWSMRTTIAACRSSLYKTFFVFDVCQNSFSLPWFEFETTICGQSIRFRTCLFQISSNAAIMCEVDFDFAGATFMRLLSTSMQTSKYGYPSLYFDIWFSIARSPCQSLFSPVGTIRSRWYLIRKGLWML